MHACRTRVANPAKTFLTGVIPQNTHLCTHPKNIFSHELPAHACQTRISTSTLWPTLPSYGGTLKKNLVLHFQCTPAGPEEPKNTMAHASHPEKHTIAHASLSTRTRQKKFTSNPEKHTIPHDSHSTKNRKNTLYPTPPSVPGTGETFFSNSTVEKKLFMFICWKVLEKEKPSGDYINNLPQKWPAAHYSSNDRVMKKGPWLAEG